LSQRIPLEQTDDLEIQRLVGSLNHMIARVERAVTGLRRFTQDAAHELRTPLAALRSRLEIALRKSRDAAAFRGLVEETLEELDALHRLVDALLLLARSDAGELPVTNQSVELRALIDEVISLYDAIAAEHAQQLFVDCSPSLVLWTDKLLLSRGLANLVDNACKFTPPGGRIGISAVQQGDAVCIRVSDSGPGISVADSQRIFERFFRGDEHRGRTAGFGLGLSLCREFVGALGGQIELARSPEGGTQASIMVPIR
jgi:two-component system OmpR family sensor kinase